MSGNWKNKTVFITGISGFVGSRLALNLLKEGAKVIGLARVSSYVPKPILDSRAVIYRGDICDYDLLRSILSYEEVDLIYHFAANAIVRTSASDPMSAYYTNVMGTVTLMEAIRVVGNVSRVVSASSDKAYGDHDKLPYVETFKLQPKNTYDTSKACMDMIARSFGTNYNFESVITRCSNIYGPGDMNLSRLIPNNVRLALNNEPTMLYSDVSEMEREFIYIDDVVAAYKLLGMKPLTSASKTMSHLGCADSTFYDSFNIGGTGPTQIKTVTDKISKICGSTLEPNIVERSENFKEIKKQHIDSLRLAWLTGWEHKTTLDEGLSKTVEWYTNYYKNGVYS